MGSRESRESFSFNEIGKALEEPLYKCSVMNGKRTDSVAEKRSPPLLTGSALSFETP